MRREGVFVRVDTGENNKSDAPNPLRMTDLRDTMLGPASPTGAPAPLAQLAEQLTLNQ
jgi:hypothetical protein